MEKVMFPIDDASLNYEDVLSTLSAYAIAYGDPPSSGISDAYSGAAVFLRGVIEESTSGLDSKTIVKYVHRVVQPTVYDAVASGALLYLALTKAPGISVPTLMMNDNLIIKLRQLKGITKDQFVPNAGKLYDEWVKYYAMFVDKFLADFKLSYESPLSVLIDKIRQAANSMFSTPTLDKINARKIKGGVNYATAVGRKPDFGYISYSDQAVIPIAVTVDDIRSFISGKTGQIFSVVRDRRKAKK